MSQQPLDDPNELIKEWSVQVYPRVKEVEQMAQSLNLDNNANEQIFHDSLKEIGEHISFNIDRIREVKLAYIKALDEYIEKRIKVKKYLFHPQLQIENLKFFSFLVEHSLRINDTDPIHKWVYKFLVDKNFEETMGESIDWHIEKVEIMKSDSDEIAEPFFDNLIEYLKEINNQ